MGEILPHAKGSTQDFGHWPESVLAAHTEGASCYYRECPHEEMEA